MFIWLLMLSAISAELFDFYLAFPFTLLLCFEYCTCTSNRCDNCLVYRLLWCVILALPTFTSDAFMCVPFHVSPLLTQASLPPPQNRVKGKDRAQTRVVRPFIYYVFLTLVIIAPCTVLQYFVCFCSLLVRDTIFSNDDDNVYFSSASIASKRCNYDNMLIILYVGTRTYVGAMESVSSSIRLTRQPINHV